MSKLTAAAVVRGGRTSRTWTDETNKVDLSTGEDELRFGFSMRSKGGGITEVRLAVGAADFAAIISALAKVDRATAMRAMAAVVASELAKQPEFDKVIACDARESVVQAATTAYDEAPSGRDHAERLTRDMVRELVDKLNKPESAESVSESEEAA